MIYLVGGAPRIGKSIIGKKLASLVSAEFVSTDDLEMPKNNLTWPSFSGDPKENITTPSDRVKLQVKIAEALQPLTEALIIEAHNDQKNIVVEGIHLLPSYVAGYIQKYSAKAVFVGWKDSEMVLIGMKQNDKPNDWLKEANAAVRRQVADFTVAFSEYIEPEAKKYGITYIERKEDFAKDLERVVSLLN